MCDDSDENSKKCVTTNHRMLKIEALGLYLKSRTLVRVSLCNLCLGFRAHSCEARVYNTVRIAYYSCVGECHAYYCMGFPYHDRLELVICHYNLDNNYWIYFRIVFVCWLLCFEFKFGCTDKP